ncbi:TonB-dependent receptor [Rhodobiaceae bacterium]|nr:TonB-dependent receptor [Rhodobiaceae bacterium]
MRAFKTIFIYLIILLIPIFMTTEIKAQAQEVEEIVVTGKAIKESQMAAIEAKRQAVNVADIISADAIGRFPDVNLSDALGRLPGISIERDQGQARYVSFRGTPKRYTTTAFNGISIPGVENGRIPRFDSYPAVITSQVFANKAITADMPGESISGFINIKTFKPSDIEGFSLSAEIGMGEQDQGGGDTSKENLRISYSDDSFGFVVYGSAHNNEQITDNREPTYGGVKGAQTPDRIDFRSYKVERESEAFGGTFEKYLDNGGRIFLTSLNTEFLDNEERNDFRAYVKNGTPTTGSGFTGSARRLFNDALYINKTEMNTLGIETSFGEWDIKAQASKIDTTFDTYMPIGYFIGGGQLTNLSYDISDPQNPIVNFDGTYRDVDYSTKLLVDAIGGLYTETDQFKIDISRENNRGELKFGLQYDDRVATGGGATLATVSVAGGYPADVCDPKEYRLGDFASPRDNSVGAFYTDNPALNDCLNTVRPPRSDFPDDEKIDIEEVLFAAYIMQTFEMDWGNIVAGLRIEDTEYETNGFRLATVSGDIGYENIAVGAKEVLSVKRTYTNYLPSVHVNYDMSEDVKLRLSYSTGISRPSYIEARAAASINILSNEIAGGNPFLKQEESWGIDAAFEWYYDEASLFSITIFHREIDNVISESNEKVDGTLYSDQAQPGELWDLAGFGNGKDGELQGLEISLNARMDNYIDGFFSGFGASLNVALIESEYTTPEGKVFALPGQSDTNYNASIFYEDHGFSARLTYRYRSEWLDETETGAVFNLGGGVYWAAQNRLDASVRYDLEALTGQKASIFADFNNITDESDMRYTAQRWNVNQVESFGRSFLAGVRYAF